MQVREAVLADAHDVAKIHVQTWQAAYRGIVAESYLDGLSVEAREVNWRRAIESGKPSILVADDVNDLLGWIAFGRCRDSDKLSNVGEIEAIYVAPQNWSTGVGRALWLAARERLRAAGFSSVTLWVLARNERAKKFYASAGFQLESGSSKFIEIAGTRLEECRFECCIAA